MRAHMAACLNASLQCVSPDRVYEFKHWCPAAKDFVLRIPGDVFPTRETTGPFLEGIDEHFAEYTAAELENAMSPVKRRALTSFSVRLPRDPKEKAMPQGTGVSAMQEE